MDVSLEDSLRLPTLQRNRAGASRKTSGSFPRRYRCIEQAGREKKRREWRRQREPEPIIGGPVWQRQTTTSQCGVQARKRMGGSRLDTARGFPVTFQSDAEPPPSRSPPSSWDLHAGGLPWPELRSATRFKRFQARRRTKPAGFFMRANSTPNQNQEKQ